MKIRLFILLATMALPSAISAQETVGARQTKSVLILNATAHIGNGQLIDNSAVGFKDGKITMVADARTIRLADNAFDIVIDAAGKHLYPGFIAPNSTLGLAEIDAVKATIDENEIGQINPNVKSIYAYNADSKIIETVRTNGVLLAQITPRGGTISGSSSIVQLDAWNWQDALLKESDGLHINFPGSFTYSRSGMIEVDKDYAKKIDEIAVYLTSAKAYNSDVLKQRNLILEAGAGLFDGTRTLYIHANEEKQITDAVEMAIANGVRKVVIVGGFEAYKVSGLLQKHKIGVLLRRVHDMPMQEEQDFDLPFRMAKILHDKGIVVGLENAGDMERMNTRNLPFLAGTCAAHGLEKEQALMLITSNTAKLLGIDAFCGSLETGKDATLFLSEGDALDMRTNKLTHAFIQGRAMSLETHQTKLNDRYRAKFNQNK